MVINSKEWPGDEVTMHHEATVHHILLDPAEHSDPNALIHATNTTQDVNIPVIQ